MDEKALFSALSYDQTEKCDVRSSFCLHGSYIQVCHLFDEETMIECGTFCAIIVSRNPVLVPIAFLSE